MLFRGRRCTNCHYVEDSNRKCSLEKTPPPPPPPTSFYQLAQAGLWPVPNRVQQDHESSDDEDEEGEDNEDDKDEGDEEEDKEDDLY